MSYFMEKKMVKRSKKDKPKFDPNEVLMKLLQTIKVDQSVKQVIQNHSGSGDNVAGDKHVTYKADH